VSIRRADETAKYHNKRTDDKNVFILLNITNILHTEASEQTYTYLCTYNAYTFNIADRNKQKKSN